MHFFYSSCCLVTILLRLEGLKGQVQVLVSYMCKSSVRVVKRSVPSSVKTKVGGALLEYWVMCRIK